MDPGDNLTVDTPEQIALEFQIAGIGSRFLAMAIDTLIQTAFYFLVGLAIALIPKLAAVPELGPWYAAVFVLTLFCIYWGYFAAFEVIWKGQTPGKRVLKIRVIKDNGRPINIYEAIGRNLK